MYVCVYNYIYIYIHIYSILSFPVSRYDSDHILIDKTKVSYVSESEEVEQVYLYIFIYIYIICNNKERALIIVRVDKQLFIISQLQITFFIFLFHFLDRRTV